jgi:hypothetical protein
MTPIVGKNERMMRLWAWLNGAAKTRSARG